MGSGKRTKPARRGADANPFMLRAELLTPLRFPLTKTSGRLSFFYRIPLFRLILRNRISDSHLSFTSGSLLHHSDFWIAVRLRLLGRAPGTGSKAWGGRGQLRHFLGVGFGAKDFWAFAHRQLSTRGGGERTRKGLFFVSTRSIIYISLTSPSYCNFIKTGRIVMLHFHALVRSRICFVTC